MQDFRRFALYHLRPPGPLADFGAAWLGWDVARGAPAPHPDLPDLPAPVGQITATPRKYGFHGTIKPPFRLAPGQTPEALLDAARRLCAGLPPVRLNALVLSRLGHFLALTPDGEAGALSDLAARVVSGLDAFRAPAPEAELARHRARGLSPRQEANLLAWGYPYVMEEFRFHMTLTGRLDPQALAATEAVLAPRLAPLLPAPCDVAELALVGADASDRFHLIERLPLLG